MNISTVIEIYAGGVGSGPTAPCPQCGHHTIGEGDRVRLKDGAKVTSVGGGKYELKPGSIAKVISVMPKIGNADQMAGIQSEKDQKNGKYGNVGYVRVDDLNLHQKMHDDALGKLPVWTKSWSRNPQSPANKAQDIQPVPKSQVLMHTTTNDGASLTWVKTPQTSEADAKNLANEEHSLKGKFNFLTSVPAGELNNPGENRVSRIYDTTRTPLESRSVNKGSTVYVSSRTSGGKITGVDIREQNTGMHAQKLSTATFSYKNAAAAIGMLKSRYGINTSLKRLRGGQ